MNKKGKDNAGIPATLDALTIREAVGRLKAIGFNGVTEHFIRKNVIEGRIPHYMNGNRYMITLDDVAGFIAEIKENAPGESGDHE